MRAASSSAATSLPLPSQEMSWFWQKTQRRLQCEKKIVPEPRDPRRQSSSPWWGNALATRAQRPVLQIARSSASRSTSQSRGQTRHTRSSSKASSTFSARRPDSQVLRYAGVNSLRGRMNRGSALTSPDIPSSLAGRTPYRRRGAGHVSEATCPLADHSCTGQQTSGIEASRRASESGREGRSSASESARRE